MIFTKILKFRQLWEKLSSKGWHYFAQLFGKFGSKCLYGEGFNDGLYPRKVWKSHGIIYEYAEVDLCSEWKNVEEIWSDCFYKLIITKILKFKNKKGTPTFKSCFMFLLEMDAATIKFTQVLE